VKKGMKTPYPLTLAIETMTRANSKVRSLFDSRSVRPRRAGRTVDSNCSFGDPVGCCRLTAQIRSEKLRSLARARGAAAAICRLPGQIRKAQLPPLRALRVSASPRPNRS